LTCQQKYNYYADVFAKERSNAFSCEINNNQYCQLLILQIGQQAQFQQCGQQAYSGSCSATCDTFFVNGINQLGCCAQRLNVTNNAEYTFRNCTNALPRLRELLRLSPNGCDLPKGNQIVNAAVSLPIRWNQIANNAALQASIITSSKRDVAAALGLDIAYIVGASLTQDIKSLVASRRRLLADTATNFNFGIQAVSNAVTSAAAANLNQQLAKGLSFSQTAALLATECPTCADTSKLLSVKQTISAAGKIFASLLSIVLVLIALL